MKKRLSIFILPFCLLIPMNAGAQKHMTTGSISGTVLESSTRSPIVGANILLLGTMMGAAADTKGIFIIHNVPVGTYEIKVTAIGYKSEEKTVQVYQSQTTELHFTLVETAILMDGVAITASRYQQSIEDIPVSIELIPAQEIHQRSITSVETALQYVPGVNAMSGGQITIRGSSGFNWGTGSRVLVLVNGQPFMSSDVCNVNWYTIPTSNINQIEVMKGSGSALYGSSAMGGVINIITQDPDEGNHFQVRTYTGFYNKPSYPVWEWTNKRMHFEGTTVNLSTHIGKVSTQLASTYKVTTGYRENDDNQNFNLMTIAGYNYSPNLRFDLMGGYASQKGGFYVYWKDLANPYENGSDPFGFHSRASLSQVFAYPSLSWIINERMFLSLKGRYSSNRTEEKLKSKTDDVVESDDDFRVSNVESQGGEAQFNYQFSGKGTLVVGGEYQNDRISSIQYGERRVTKASYYTQLEQRFFQKLKVTVGARYDGEKIRSSNSSGELSGKFGLNFNLSPKTNFRFSLGEGFRIPAIAERFVSTFTGGLHVRENPDLEPERSYSAEIGVRQNIMTSMNFDLALFYTQYQNLIEPQLEIDPIDNAGVVRFKNVAEARIQGVDFSLRTDWWSRQFTTQIGYTYLDSKDYSRGDNWNKPLKYRSRHTIYLTTDFRLNVFTMGVDFRYLSIIERVDELHKVIIKDLDKRVPTYVTSLRFGIIPSEHYSLQMTVENIFQYNYLVSPANMGPPLNATIQLHIQY